jgi:hypothetical protein
LVELRSIQDFGQVHAPGKIPAALQSEFSNLYMSRSTYMTWGKLHLSKPTNAFGRMRRQIESDEIQTNN